MMEDRNELSDILLTDETVDKAQKRKRLLLIVALLILLFVLILVVMKILNNPNEPVSLVDDSLVPTGPVIETPNEYGEPQTPLEVMPTLSNIEEIEETNVAAPVITTPIITNQEPKPTATQTTEATKTASSGTVIKGKYYIQVGSFAKTPSKDFLKKIEQKNYSSAKEEIVINSRKTTKLFIGPYNTEKEARDILPKIKQDIVKDAFLLKK